MEGPNGPLRRLGVLGGTFDPIHLGHLIAASEVMHAWHLDRVLFVPTGQPWQKSKYSPAEDRFMMTSQGVLGDRRFAVSRMELDRSGPTYTADTLDALRGFHGSDIDLFFIAGADAVLKLGTWVHAERVAQLAEVIAVTRPGYSLDNVPAGEGLPKVHVYEMRAIDISATDIRERVGTGRPIDHLVPKQVGRYIRERGLYLENGGMADAC